MLLISYLECQYSL